MFDRSADDVPRIEEMIARESAAWEAVVQHAAALPNLPHFDLVAHWGDGNCGSVLSLFYTALRETGFYVDPPKPQRHAVALDVPPSVRKMVYERDEYRCRHCGTWLDLTIDHIIPRVKGGTHDPDNLQTLCKPCNSRKGDR